MLARIGKNFGAQLIGLVISLLDRFLVVGVLIRAWGGDVYSDWLLLGSVAGLIALTELGANIYFGNIWQKAFAEGNSEVFQRAVSLAVTTALGFGVALMIALVGALGPAAIASTIGLRWTSPPTGEIVLLLLGWVAISRNMRGCLSQIYRGRDLYALGTLIDQAYVLSVSIGTIGVAELGAGPVTVASVTVACDLVFGWFLVFWNLRVRFPDLNFRPALPSGAEIGDFLLKTRWLLVLQGAPVAWLSLPIVIMNQLGLAADAIVGFALVRTLINMTRQIGMMLSLSVGVELAGAFHTGGKQRAVAVLQRFGQLLSAIAAIGAVAILAFGQKIASVWTGHGDFFDLGVAAWMAAASLLLAPAIPVSSLQMFTNMPRAPALASIAQLVIGLMGMVALSGIFGIVGATAGLALGEMIGVGVLLPVLCARKLGIDYPQYAARCFVASLKAGLLSGLVAGLLLMFHQPGSGLMLVFLLGLWGLFGAIPAFIMAMQVSERAEVAMLLRSALTRLRLRRAV